MGKIFKIEKNKSLIITTEYIAISDKNFNDYNEMKEKSEMISHKKAFHIIKNKDIHKIWFNGKGSKIKIKYASETNVNDKLEIIPSDINELLEIANLIGQTFSMELTETDENKLKHLMINSLKVLISLIFSYIIILASINMQNGIEYEISGRRKAFSKLLLSVVDFIGPIGTSIVCGLIIGYYIYKLVKRYKNPSRDFEYKRIISTSK